MIFSKRSLFIGTIATTAMVASPFAVVACSNSVPTFDFGKVQKQIKSGDYNFAAADWSFESVDWDKVAHVDATIDYWIDGDTPKVLLDEDFAGFLQGESISLRVVGIDTPELHVKDPKTGIIDKETTGIEYEYAEQGRVFGDSEMKPGTHIRIATSGDKSFNRLSGGIFYGKNFSKNYSTEILKKGLAYPFISDTITMMDKDNIMHYILLPIADAYNRARNGKIGIFSKPDGEVSKVHGPTDTSKLEWKNHDMLTDNIYKTIAAIGSDI